MISRYEVYLHGDALGQIDPNIYVHDILYDPPRMDRESQRLASGLGSYHGRAQMASQTITVEFTVEAYDPAERQRIMQDIAAWAYPGGWLSTSDRYWQRIYVECDQIPTAESALKWLDKCKVTFVAYEFPYWQNLDASTATINASTAGTAAGASVTNTGYIPAFVELDVTLGGALTDLSIFSGGKNMHFTGLDGESTQHFKLYYTDDRHILVATLNEASVLDKLTSASDDRLIVPARTTQSVTILADAAVTANVTVRGLSL